jgi:predicted dienelactone hydrolase
MMKRNGGMQRPMKRLHGFGAGVLLIWLFLPFAKALSSWGQANEPAKPPNRDIFPRPTGPYAVGTHEYLWIDQNREEPFTKDPADRRHILARVWYPAEAVTAKETASYIADVNEYPENSFYRQWQNTKTNSVTDAPLAKCEEPFPVLLYQPGGGMARFIATFQAEQLASHGYVIVSSDHAGFGQTVLFPDGFRFQADLMLAPQETGYFREDALRSWSWLEKDIFPTWTADASYTLDKITELANTPGHLFYKRLDLARIGMMGWSFGGATSIQMSKDDPRVKAAIDQDGQLFGDVWDKGTSRPLMLMHHGDEDKAPKPEDNPFMKAMIELTRVFDRSLLEHSTNDWYEITIAKTNHGHFSDLPLFFPNSPADLDPARAHEIINAYTLAFFDKYLRGRKSELLEAPSVDYPEVMFRRNK